MPEWVLHAAGQDLPSLAPLGLRPRGLFDTELAGRLLGYPRVGLATMVEAVLGLTLEKGHSAVDWSTRPLPEPWLRYAALDVEILVELRDVLDAQLREQGKRQWAEEEFASSPHLLRPSREPIPWRRTSGLHRVRRRRQLAIVRALWEQRDRLARQRDLSPRRVLPDTASSRRRWQARPRIGAGRNAVVPRPWYAPPARHLVGGGRAGAVALRRAASAPGCARLWGPAPSPHLGGNATLRLPSGSPRAVVVATLADEHRPPGRERAVARHCAPTRLDSPPDAIGVDSRCSGAPADRSHHRSVGQGVGPDSGNANRMDQRNLVDLET